MIFQLFNVCFWGKRIFGNKLRAEREKKKNYWANFEDRVSSYALAQLFLTRKKIFFLFLGFWFLFENFFLFIFQRTNREIFLFNTKVINKTNLSKCLRTTLQWLVSMKHQTKKQNSGNHMSNPWKVSQSMREKKIWKFLFVKTALDFGCWKGVWGEADSFASWIFFVNEKSISFEGLFLTLSIFSGFFEPFEIKS